MAHQLALVTAVATLVLILFGGLVTNTGAALAVPDWPSTFGHPMFLFPWSGMVGGVFYEHSHRLIGAAVGLCTLALAAALWARGGPLRWWGALAVLAVVVQGVLGGLRVVWREDDLAILHGSLAQAFFALVAALAAVTSLRWRHPRVAAAASTRALAVLASVLVYAQIVFGALLTHAGRIDLHLAGAVAVVVVLPILTARLRRDGDPLAAPLAGGLLGLLVLQLLLGAGSFLARFSSVWIPGEQLTMLVLPVVHRLAGSLLLGAVVILALRVVPGAARRTRPAAAPARLARQAP